MGIFSSRSFLETEDSEIQDNRQLSRPVNTHMLGFLSHRLMFVGFNQELSGCCWACVGKGENGFSGQKKKRDV